MMHRCIANYVIYFYVMSNDLINFRLRAMLDIIYLFCFFYCLFKVDFSMLLKLLSNAKIYCLKSTHINYGKLEIKMQKYKTQIIHFVKLKYLYLHLRNFIK